jgi:hypothetical protein
MAAKTNVHVHEVSETTRAFCFHSFAVKSACVSAQSAFSLPLRTGTVFFLSPTLYREAQSKLVNFQLHPLNSN